MNTLVDTPMDALVALLVLAGLLVVVVGWVLLFFMLFSRISGWGRLARAHAAVATAIGREFRGVHGKVGPVRFKGLATTVCVDGLYLRFVLPRFYPPLFIPWSAVSALDTDTGLLSFRSEQLKLVLGDPTLPAVSLVGKPVKHVVEAFQAHRDRRSP
jgi:hypothetical protein